MIPKRPANTLPKDFFRNVFFQSHHDGLIPLKGQLLSENYTECTDQLRGTDEVQIIVIGCFSFPAHTDCAAVFVT